jgi:hypothetical protein
MNTVLYVFILDRNIMTAEEVQFLRCLHDAVHFPTSSGLRVHFRNGVHQGSPLSPALFNIFMQ